MHSFIVLIVSVSCTYICVNFSLFFLMCRVWIGGLALPTSLVWWVVLTARRSPFPGLETQKCMLVCSWISKA
jgi:hypothetical protein